MKKWCGIVLFFVSMLFLPMTAKASSGIVQFSSTKSEVAKGDTITVVCQINTTDEFVDTVFAIRYDDNILTFLSGGKKVTGGDGVLQVFSTGNTQATTKKTFSLQFKAKKKGTTLISLEGAAKVTDADGNAFSMSSNDLSVTVVKKGSQVTSTEKPKESIVPKVTPKPQYSKENRLKTLHVNALSMSPAFSPDVRQYDVTVDCNTSILYVSYVPEDEKSRVLLKGNENLAEGENTVIIRVTAESGAVADYRMTVTKESEAKTEEREKKATNGGNAFSFLVHKDGNRVLIQNSYEFEVLDPSSVKDVPAGYVQTNIQLNGITVPVFAVEQNLDNNYLLLYLKGPSGESGWYQYDREEKTLQRYTGAMTERVNRGTEHGGMASLSTYVLVGIIVVLIVLLLCMLIVMLKMASNRKKAMSLTDREKAGKEWDDLDF